MAKIKGAARGMMTREQEAAITNALRARGTGDRERIERCKRVLANLTAELAAAKRLLKGPAPIEAMERQGRTLAECGGMLHDAARGRAPTERASTTRKIRKALGYTYP